LDAEGIAPPLDAGGAAVWNEREHDTADDLLHEFAVARAIGPARVTIRLDAINAELARLR
jgi:hypothetical protein